jgi:putative hydrolases of HD superfamily
MEKNKTKTLANFSYELGTLRKIIRAHRQVLITDDTSDNIASHSFRVAILGWFLAKEEKVDPYKVLLMCLFHDVSEARSNDLNWVHKKYVKVFEDEIIKDQFTNLPHEKELLRTLNEYNQRVTKESKVAKDADLLDQILLIEEYSYQGNEEAKLWKKGKGTHVKKLTSNSARKLAKEIKSQKPSAWWSNIWTPKRR